MLPRLGKLKSLVVMLNGVMLSAIMLNVVNAGCRGGASGESVGLQELL